jgi:hypothetical protein
MPIDDTGSHTGFDTASEQPCQNGGSPGEANEDVFGVLPARWKQPEESDEEHCQTSEPDSGQETAVQTAGDVNDGESSLDARQQGVGGGCLRHEMGSAWSNQSPAGRSANSLVNHE